MDRVSQLPFPVKRKYALSDISGFGAVGGGSSPYLRNATINGIPSGRPPGYDPSSPSAQKSRRDKRRFQFPKVSIEKVGVVDQCGDYDVVVEIKGNVVEYLEVENPVKVGPRAAEAEEDTGYTAFQFPEIAGVFSRTYGVPEKDVPVLSPEDLLERAARSAKESARRRRSKLATLVNVNFAEASSFLTLTFAEQVTIDQGWQAARSFANRLLKKFPDYAYIQILELTKQGRPHFHLLVKGVPPAWFEKRWYVKTKKGAGPFQFLLEDGSMGRDFSRVRLYESKTAAKTYAKARGLQVAYTSPAVKEWKQGFVELHALLDREGESISDVGAYMLKYVTKQDALPSGVTNYSFSRGKLKQKGKRLLRLPAKQWFQWLRSDFASFIKHERVYTGKNDFLGQWSKVYLTLDRDFARFVESQVDEWFWAFQHDYEGLAALTVPRGSPALQKLMGITSMVTRDVVR